MKFTKEKGSAEFAPPSQPKPPPTDTGRELSQFYASVVQTSGNTWADNPDQAAQVPSASTAAGQVPIGVEILPPGERYREPAGPPTLDESLPTKSGSLVLPKDSIGWKLLEKTGWKEGKGIGAQEQGQIEPIQPDVRSKNVGLGFESKSSRKKKAKPDTESAGKSAGSAKTQQAKRPLPPDELVNEDLETKIKRVKQVMQAEADDKATKALAEFVYREFSDDPRFNTTDINPLLRKNKRISATNPLLMKDKQQQ